MPPVVIPNAMLAVASGTVYGQPWVNVIGLHNEIGTTLTQAIADQLGADVRGIYSELQPLLVNDWQLNEIVIQDLRTATAPSFEASITALVGTNISDGMPPHIAACATHRTEFRGRSFRGRTYLAGFGEDSSTTNGQILTLTRTEIADAFDLFRTNLQQGSTIGIFHAVVSRTLETTTEVIETTCDAEWDRQTRRKRS